MSDTGEREESDLREYALLIWGRKGIIVLVTLLATGLTLAYCVIATPKYEGTATLLLTPPLSPTLLEANGSLQTQIVDVPSDLQVISSSTVQQLVGKTIPNPPSVSVTQVGTTDVVQISVTDADPQRAAAAATAYAHAYIKFEQQQTLDTLTNAAKLLQNHIDTIQIAIGDVNNKIAAAAGSPAVSQGLQLQLTSLDQENTALENELANYDFFQSSGTTAQSGQILSPATVPTKPVSPKTVSWTIIAAFVGFIVGVGLAMLVEALSDKSKPRARPRHSRPETVSQSELIKQTN